MFKHINNNIVCSIAGFDPSAGAGVLADIKTFENNQVYGYGVSTSITIQNENNFTKVYWLKIKQITDQINILFETENIDFIKIGLIENMKILLKIIQHLISINKKIKIIWDPIIASSSGYVIHKKFAIKDLITVLKNIYLITPNFNEIKFISKKNNMDDVLKFIGTYTNVLLKGGHFNAFDILLENGKTIEFQGKKIKDLDKHGTGCVLSSAIVANLSKSFTLFESCKLAKDYTYQFIKSNKGLLGDHWKIKIYDDKRPMINPPKMTNV